MRRKFTFLTAAFALLAFFAIPMGMRGQTTTVVTYTFSDHFSSNSTDLTGLTFDEAITASFAKGSGSTAPQYYTNGTAVRWYGNNTLEIVAANATMSQIEITYTQKNKDVTANVGTYTHSTGIWMGSDSSVTFTVASGSGHNRVSAIKVTYTSSGTGPTVATPTFSPAGGIYSEAQTVSISCETTGTTIYYTLDGSDPDDESMEYSGPITVSETKTIKAIAIDGDDNLSAIATATYTILTPMTIAEVRAQQTGNVATMGTVTSCVGTTGYIQDATAAICVYGATLTVGDNISVIGTLSSYHGLLEITNPQITVNSSGNTINPEVMTVAQVVTSTNQGWYIRVVDATVTAIDGQNTTITQGDSTIVVRGITGVEYVVDDVISLNGNIGCYDGNQIANPQNVEVQENPNPNISAENVSIAFDATNGTIEYTINNPVTGGVLSATTNDQWITLGEVGTTVPFTCTANNEITARTATVTLTYTYNRATVTKDVTVTQAAYEAPHYTWDLSTASYASESDTLVIWTSDYATMMIDKANAGTPANNYLGGNQTSTRFYKNSEITISPATGYAITNVVFNATTTGYASALQASTWTNATATVNDKVVTVTPTEGTLDIFAVISNTCGFTGVTVYYVEDNTPTIIANNVEIAYDATYGEVPFTLNATGFPGELSVSDNVDWIYDAYPTLDLTKVTFHATVNEAANPREGIITITFVYNRETVSKSVTVTQAGNPNAVNSISEITDAGDYIVQGTIVAKSQRGFIVGDGTGYVYYYNQNYTQADYNIGDLVRLDGPVVVYNGVFEFNSSTTVTAAESSNYMTEDPTVLSGADMDARVASTTPPQLSSYVQYEGTLSITVENNNTYYNITNIAGATTAEGSISFPLDVEGITALDGKQVVVTGYYVGVSSSKYYNTMIGSIEENTEPSITLDTYAINAPAAGAEGIINATYQNLDGVLGLVSVDFFDEDGVTPTTCNWITTVFDDNDNVHYVINANQGDARTAYFRVVFSAAVDWPKSRDGESGVYSSGLVTVTQAAYVPTPVGGDYIRITSLDQLTDGSKVIIASRYDTDATNYYAMKNTISNGKAQGVTFVSTTSNGNEILPATIVNDVNNYYWVVSVNDGAYTFTNANGDVISYNTSTNFNMNGANTTWSIAIDTSGAALVPYYEGFVITNTTTTNRGIALRDNDGNKVFGAYSTTNMNGDTYNFFLDFFVQTEATQTVTQTVQLTAGTNWFSTYVDITLDDLKAALATATPNKSITIKAQRGNVVYSPRTHAWNGTMEWDVAALYKIIVAQDCEITLEGMPINPEEHPVLIPGSGTATWIGFPFSESMTLTNAFAGFAQNGDVIKSKEGNSTYSRGRWQGTALTSLVPGQGYIYVSASNAAERVLVYPTPSKAANNSVQPAVIGKTPK